MFHTQASPSVYGMQMTVARLYDGWVGILVDRAVLERHPVFPMQSVVAEHDRQRSSRPFLFVRLNGPIVANECIAPVFQVDGIQSAVVVRHVYELQFAPCLSVVVAEGNPHMTAPCAAESLQSSVGQHEDAGLDSEQSAVGFYEIGSFPCLTQVVAVFKVTFPSVTLVAGRCNESALVHDNLVLDGSIEVVGQLFAATPRLSSVFRAYHPSFPSCNVHTNFEVDAQFAVGHFVDDRVPTSLAIVGTEHTVGRHLRCSPFGSTFRFAAHPDAYIGVSLVCTAEIGGHQVALLCFHDAGRMALWEGSASVEELVGEYGDVKITSKDAQNGRSVALKAP